MSSRPWVGCAWRPSPALTTRTWSWPLSRRCLAIRCGAPDCEWRTTNMSACIADRLSMVSSSDSPLLALEAEMFGLMTSADSRLAAISNVVRVRVEFSKNRLNTLLPRISGTFFTSRSDTPTNEEAVSRMWVTMDRGRPSMVSRCCSSPFLFSCGLSIVHRQGKLAVVGTSQHEGVVKMDGGRDEVGGDRQLAAAAIDQRGQQDLGRTAIVEQLVDRGTRGAAGVQHVVHQQNRGAVDIERDLGRLDLVMQPLFRKVIAVERDIDKAEPFLQLQFSRESFGQPGAA